MEGRKKERQKEIKKGRKRELINLCRLTCL